MTLAHTVDILGGVVFISEVVLFIKRRAAGPHDVVSDSRSLRMIWRTIGIALAVTVISRSLHPSPLFSGKWFEILAITMMVSGLAMRWYPVAYLGKQFTVNVAIIEGHRLITTGPYSLVRHPSYTGLLVIFAALAIHSNHPVGLIALTIPLLVAVGNRIRIEEKAMAEAFGSEYEEYRSRTKKLVPGIF